MSRCNDYGLKIVSTLAGFVIASWGERGATMKQMIIKVRETENNFSGYRVDVSWTNFGMTWRSASFTKWENAIAFIANWDGPISIG